MCSGVLCLLQLRCGHLMVPLRWLLLAQWVSTCIRELGRTFTQVQGGQGRLCSLDGQPACAVLVPDLCHDQQLYVTNLTTCQACIVAYMCKLLIQPGVCICCFSV